MKFDYNNDNNINDSHLNYQVSQDNGLHHNHFGFKQSREEARYKRLKKLLVSFTLILLELLVIILMAFYFVSPLNRISKVSVSGNRTILANSMIHNLRAKPGDSVFRLMIHGNHFKKHAFKENAQLKAIYISIHRWNHVKVRISEYPVIAYLQNHGRYYAVTNNGEVAYQCTRPNQIYPILNGFHTGFRLRQFIKNYRQLPDSVKPDINLIKYVPNNVDPNRIHIYMSDGNQIYANDENWQHKMKYYAAISKSLHKRSVINMELGVYSKNLKR